MEEAILYLLEASGYRTVTNANGDSTLHEDHGSLSVVGRGGRHQIDGIADFAVGQPFSHPQRLLVEVKFHTRPVDIDVVRNAVGVLQDVREYWTGVSNEHEIFRLRYQYTYAIFSASEYRSSAQRYAYAHDIYLIPLARSTFILPIITAIKNIGGFALPYTGRHFLKNREELIPHDETARAFRHPELKNHIRAAIRDKPRNRLSSLAEGTALNLLEQFCSTCRQLDGAVLGMISRQFPVFLVPSPGVDLHELHDCSAKIYWDDRHHWYLQLITGERFSFDLPEELFQQYAENNMLSEASALDLKAERLYEIQAIVKQGEHVRIVTFYLDFDWLERVRRNLRQEND
jgi:hypothetical protein